MPGALTDYLPEPSMKPGIGQDLNTEGGEGIPIHEEHSFQGQGFFPR